MEEMQRYNSDLIQQMNSVPEVGDVYIPKSLTHSGDILKIISVEDNGTFGCLRYDFKTRKFVETERNKISLSDLKEYYRKTLTIFSDLVDIVIKDQRQLLTEQYDNIRHSTSLAVSNAESKEEIIAYSHKMELLANKTEESQIILKCYIEYKKSLLDEKLKEFDDRISLYKDKIKEINQMVSAIELYYGIKEEVKTIATGTTASIDTKISIRQKILFMDEECAISDVYGHLKDGFDYNNIEDFCSWLKDTHNRDQVIPEQKSIVVLKPRRYNKDYRSSYENALLNQYNRESYILIRNGENLYLIFTENLYIYDTVFPSKDVANKLFEKISQDFRKKSGEEIDYRSIFSRTKAFAVFVQGILDRTTLLHPIKENSNYLYGSADVEYIYDDDNILSDSKPRYRECFKKYYREFPEIPEDGIYEVSEILTDEYYGERICFKYRPGGQYYSFTDGYKDRTIAVTFCATRNSDWIINYDQLELSDIDYYLNSRIDRPSYNNFLPLLKTVRQQLIKEQQSEQLFIDLVMNHLRLKDRQIVIDCVSWWKYKNKIKRSIDKNDALAYKMITTRIKTLKKNDGKE